MNVFKEFFKEDDKVEEPKKEEQKKYEGKIIRVDEKGWGFISSQMIPFTRIFFHWTALTQDTLKFPALRNKMKVEFTAVEISKEQGWRAFKVRVIDDKK